jgi:hypothetical protein
MSRLPANQKYPRHRTRWQRYEKPQPGHRLQMDVQFLERIPGTPQAAVSVHSHRRLHPHSRPQGLRRVQPEHGDPIHRRGTPSLTVPRPRRPNGQRGGIPVALPLARGKPRHPACVHPTAHTTSERQGGTITSSERPGVLPAAGQRRGERRHSSVQRETTRVGGLLQLPPAAWGTGRPDPVRTAAGKGESLSVTSVFGLYKRRLAPQAGLEPATLRLTAARTNFARSNTARHHCMIFGGI